MTVKIAPDSRRQFLDASGRPYSGAKLFYYAAGSTTKQNTYTTSAGNVANSNPVLLDSAGRTPYGVWFTSGLTYKEVLAPSTDTDPPGSPIYTEDNISGVNDTTTTVSQWVASSLTPTYVSATQFTVAGDQTTDLHVGRRLQFTVTAGTVYGRISVSAYTVLTTVTVVMDSGQNLDNGLTSFNWSILTATNPAVPKLADASWQGLNVLPLGGGAVTGSVTVGGTLGVTGATTLSSTLGVTGAATMSSTLGVTGAATLSSTLGVTGATTLSGALAVTGAITPSSTNGIVGTTTSDNANALSVGEYISASVAIGSAVSLTTTVSANVTSISLTAGDWDVSGIVSFLMGASTSVTSLFGGISLTSNAIDEYQYSHRCAAFVPGALSMGYPTPTRRISISSTTTVYLVATAGFTVSTCGAWGTIRARRKR